MAVSVPLVDLCFVMARVCTGDLDDHALYLYYIVVEYTRQLSAWVKWKEGRPMISEDGGCAFGDAKMTVGNFMACMMAVKPDTFGNTPSLAVGDVSFEWGQKICTVCSNDESADVSKRRILATHLVSLCHKMGMAGILENAVGVKPPLQQYTILSNEWDPLHMYCAISLMHCGNPADLSQWEKKCMTDPFLSFFALYFCAMFPSLKDYMLDRDLLSRSSNPAMDVVRQLCASSSSPCDVEKTLRRSCARAVECSEGLRVPLGVALFDAENEEMLIQPLRKDEVQSLLSQCGESATFLATAIHSGEVELCHDCEAVVLFAERSTGSEIHVYNITF